MAIIAKKSSNNLLIPIILILIFLGSLIFLAARAKAQKPDHKSDWEKEIGQVVNKIMIDFQSAYEEYKEESKPSPTPKIIPIPEVTADPKEIMENIENDIAPDQVWNEDEPLIDNTETKNQDDYKINYKIKKIK